MDRQPLRDWVHRYNAEGLPGLADRRGAGRRPLLSPEQKARLAARVDAGPIPPSTGWCAGGGSTSSAGWPTSSGWRCTSARWASSGRRCTSATCRSAPIIRSATCRPRRLLKKLRGDGGLSAAGGGGGQAARDLVSRHEARISQHGTLTRIWARRGSRPAAPRDISFDYAYLFGAVCPERTATAALVLPRSDTDAFALHLAEISRTVAEGAHAVVVIDGAPWHGARALAVPDNLTLVTLPPYSPELNPVEGVWEYLRGNKLAITVFDDYDDIIAKSCDAWNFFANDRARVTSITSRPWAQVNQ